MVHYYGNGRKNTGDWCFRNGYITFRDIANLYMEHSRGRVLSIVPDCHSSGRWVSECAEFLDEQGVKPCGHSATEKRILLKVFASCKTWQDAAELCYTTRAMELKDDGYVYHQTRKELIAQQTTFGVAFTEVRCKKEDECGISSDSTWSTAGELISERMHIIRGRDKGRPAWHYILLDDDAEKIRDFIHRTQGQSAGTETIKLNNYGTVLKSGQGCHCCILLEQHLLPRHYNWGSSHNIAHRLYVLATKNSAFVVIFLGEQNFSGWRVSAKIMRFERYTVISVSRDHYFRSLTVTTTLTMTLSRSTSSRSSRKSGERIHKN